LGYFDLETRVLEPLENPFGPKVLPMSPERSVTHVSGLDPFRLWWPGTELNRRRQPFQPLLNIYNALRAEDCLSTSKLL